MINGNYVPNTTIGTSLSGVSSGLDELNQRDEAQALEQERYNQEQAFRDKQFNEGVRQYDQNFDEDKDRYKTGLAIDESRYIDQRGDAKWQQDLAERNYLDGRTDAEWEQDYKNRSLDAQIKGREDAFALQQEAHRRKTLKDDLELQEKLKEQEDKAYQDRDTYNELIDAIDLYTQGGKDYFGASWIEKGAKNIAKGLLGDAKGKHDISKFDAIKNIFDNVSTQKMRETLGAQFTEKEGEALKALTSGINLSADQFEKKATILFNAYRRKNGLEELTRKQIFDSSKKRTDKYANGGKDI